MSAELAANLEFVKNHFEGRQGIYIEHGALRICVTNIETDVKKQLMSADVAVIPTPGLPVGALARFGPSDSWRIGTIAEFSSFADEYWSAQYPRWSIFFSERVVEGIVELASRWPDDRDDQGRYEDVNEWLLDHAYVSRAQSVNPNDPMQAAHRAKRPGGTAAQQWKELEGRGLFGRLLGFLWPRRGRR